MSSNEKPKIFKVKLVEVVHYYGEYTRDEVLNFMAISDLTGDLHENIRSEYEALTDEELESAFRAELRLSFTSTSSAVTEAIKWDSDVQSTDFEVTLEAGHTS